MAIDLTDVEQVFTLLTNRLHGMVRMEIYRILHRVFIFCRVDKRHCGLQY